MHSVEWQILGLINTDSIDIFEIKMLRWNQNWIFGVKPPFTFKQSVLIRLPNGKI